MSKITVGVVEDEIIIADSICSTLKKLGYLTTSPCISYTDAIEMLEKEKPDIVILDIMLAGQKTGIDLAKTIKEHYDLPFIFLTSNADHDTVNKAKVLDPSAYLIKPFSSNDLYSSIEIALHNYIHKKSNKISDTPNIIIHNSFFVKKKNNFYKIKFEDITYFSSDHVYIELNTIQKQKYLIRDSLNNILLKLPSEGFIRIHRKYVVNLHKIENFSVDNVCVSGENLPLARSFKDDLFNAFEKL